MATYSNSASFDSRPWHVLNYKIVTSVDPVDSTLTRYTWSATITTSGNPNNGPFGTGNINNRSAPATTYVSGKSNNPIAFSYDYRSPNQNYTINLGSGIRTGPTDGQPIDWDLTVDMGLAGQAIAYITTMPVTPPTPAPDVFTNTPFAGATVGAYYDDTVYSYGSTTGITRTGNLPPGLTGVYSNQGYNVYGTPTTGGTYSFTLTASNGVGGTRTYAASITAVVPPAPSAFTSVPLHDGQARVAYTADDAISTNATSYSVSGLPPGLTASDRGSSVRISGTPTGTGGTYNVSMTASNVSGTASYSQVMRIIPPPTITTPFVIGKDKAAADSTLQTAGFSPATITLTTVGATVSNNYQVLAQTPTSGTTAYILDVPALTAYDYKQPMPNIVGLTDAAAKDRLAQSNFTITSSSLSTVGATLANNGTVKSQAIIAGTSTNIATPIAYVLYDYRVAMPNVVGQSKDPALVTLINAGLTNIVITLTAVGATTANNKTIKSQTPTASTSINPANTAVSLVMYSLGVTGKRLLTPTTSTQISTAKVFRSGAWVDVTTAKVFRNGVWVDITN